jgi:hydroxyacylglutathione hydrolase
MHCSPAKDQSLSTLTLTGNRENTMVLQILTVPCLADNYAYLAHDPATGVTAVIDVPEAEPILQALDKKGWSASLVLLTHHHADHVQGLDALRARHSVSVIGAAADAHRLPPLDHRVAEGDLIKIGSEEGRVLDVSGHTLGHIAFHFPTSAVVFTADSLMAMGCGRVFEGTMPQMFESLGKLANLPPETLVCSGHEYTQSNAKFALTVDPDNPALISRVKEISAARAAGRPTVPSTLAEELATNPFLRAENASVQAHLGMSGRAPVDVFAEIRARKDRF